MTSSMEQSVGWVLGLAQPTNTPRTNHPKIEIFLLISDVHYAFGELQSSKKMLII